MIELILLQQADVDVQAAFDRYEDYQEGRGELFMRHLDAAFTLLRRNPEMAPPYAGSYRRLLVRSRKQARQCGATLRRVAMAVASL